MELQKITEENRKSKRIIEVMAEDLLTVNKKIKVALSLAHVFALTLKVTLVLALALSHTLIDLGKASKKKTIKSVTAVIPTLDPPPSV